MLIVWEFISFIIFLIIYLITNSIIANLMIEYWYRSPIICFIFISLLSWMISVLINRFCYSKYIFG